MIYRWDFHLFFTLSNSFDSKGYFFIDSVGILTDLA